MTSIQRLVCILALAVLSASSAAAQSVRLDLPWRLIQLENGARLLLHRDTLMPETGVEVFTRGGSREERSEHYGASHLFEHYLPAPERFLGNPQNRAAWSRASRGSGAGAQPDFLRFYLVGKPEALEAMIGNLADRIASDSTKFLEAPLEKDKNIVYSEMRRSFNIDWDAEVLSRLHAGTFGPDHPYGHSTTGTERGVRAVTTDVMRDWHADFFGAANLIIIVSGNFDLSRAERLVRKHFGPIRPGRVAPRAHEWIPPARPLRESIEKEIGGVYVYKQWPIPGFGSSDSELLDLFARIFARRAPAAVQATGMVELWELAGAFRVRGTGATIAAADSVERTLAATLDTLLRNGPTTAEVAAARTQLLTEFVSRLQAPVWRGGRGDILGQGLLFRDDPDYYRTYIARTERATPAQIRAAAQRWLAPTGYTLQVLPTAKRTAAAAIDRSATMEPVPPTAITFPEPTVASTPAGTRVLLVHRPQLPLAQITLAVRAGSIASNDLAAAASFAAFRQNLTDSLTALGASVATGMDADLTYITASVLSANAGAVGRTMLRVLERNPTYSAATIENAGARALADARAQRATPTAMRDVIAECVLYATGNCEAVPAPQKSDAAAVRKLLAERYTPGNAVLIASGDVDAAMFGATNAPAASAPAKTPPKAVAPGAESAWVIDSPTATQAHTLLLVRVPDGTHGDPIMAQLLAFALRQRLMANLRSDKGWSYEVYPFGLQLREGHAFMRFNAPLTLDKLGEAIAEILKEMQTMTAEPPTELALNTNKSYVEGSLLLPGLSSLVEMNRQLLELPRNHLPAGYYAAAQDRLRAITPEQVQAAAREVFRRQNLTWIVAAPAAVVVQELTEAGLAPRRVTP